MKLLVVILLYLTGQANCLDYTEIVVKIIETYISEILDTAGNETECGKQLRIYVADIKTSEMWALQMLDSSAKLNPGVLTGNLVQIGNYDECLEINEISNGSQIKGQYCRSMVTPTQTVNQCIDRHFNEKGISGIGKMTTAEMQDYLQMSWDICIPAACSTEEIQNIWEFAEARYEFKFHLLFKNDLCTTVEKINNYSLLHIVAIIVFAIIGNIVFMSTLYDIFIFQKRKDKEYNFFMAFSYYTNGKRILSIKDKDETKITCLHGIRVISMAWIILGHRVLLNFVGNAINYAYMAEWLQHDENMMIVGAPACVDTFFVISGFLIVYLIMMAKDKGLEVNLIVFYVHRILRLTPSLAAIILVYVGILPHLGSGPYWNYVDEILVQTCVDNWWSTLTFTQNYLNPMTTCVMQAWYLSVDTHLYILSPLLFLPLQRWPKPTIVLITGLILVSAGFAVHTTYKYKLYYGSIRVVTDYFVYLYTPTHLRIGPWLLGILLGYVMFQTRNKKIEISKKYVFLWWAVCLIIMLLNLYASLIYIRMKFTLLEAALFNVFARLFWGASICWIIFACARGHGGYINTFLSLPVFNVLARLTYAMYLTHGLVVGTIQGQKRTTPYLHNLFHFYEIWGDFAFTIGISIIWTMTFESPVSILESVLIKKALKKNEKKEDICMSNRL